MLISTCIGHPGTAPRSNAWSLEAPCNLATSNSKRSAFARIVHRLVWPSAGVWRKTCKPASLPHFQRWRKLRKPDLEPSQAEIDTAPSWTEPSAPPETATAEAEAAAVTTALPLAAAAEDTAEMTATATEAATVAAAKEGTAATAAGAAEEAAAEAGGTTPTPRTTATAAEAVGAVPAAAEEEAAAGGAARATASPPAGPPASIPGRPCSAS